MKTHGKELQGFLHLRLSVIFHAVMDELLPHLVSLHFMYLKPNRAKGSRSSHVALYGGRRKCSVGSRFTICLTMT